MERAESPRLRRGHDRFRAGRRGRKGVLAEPEVSPPAGRAHRLLPRPRLHGPGGRRAERPRRPPAGVRRHGGDFAEHLAFAAIRCQGSEPVRRPVPHRGLLLQDVHAAALPMAGLRERAQEVRERRARVAGHRTDPSRQAVRESRRARRGRRSGRDGRGRGRGPGWRLSPARRRGASPRRASALGHRRGPGRSRRAGRSGLRRARHRGADRRGGARPVRRQLGRGPGTPRDGGRRGSRAPYQGARQGTRRRAGPDRAAVRVRRQ